MNQWEQLRALVTPPVLPVFPLDLGMGEREVTRVAAECHPGSLSSVAGDLVLTTARLLFTPLVVHGIADAREWSCLEGSHELVHVSAGRSPGLLRPPTIHVTDAAGAVTEVGVLSGRTTPNFSAANARARDAFLDELPRWLARSV